MLPIVAIPESVNCWREAFADTFTDPQLRHLLEYLTGLLVGPNRTVQGINDRFLGHADQSNKNRFLTASPWSEEELQRIRFQGVAKHLAGLSTKSCYLIIDDTLLEKTGRHIEGADWHYSHAKGRTVWGHCLVSSHLMTPRIHVPGHFELYRREKSVPQDEFRTKIELAMELIDRAEKMGFPFGYVIMDAWYFTKKLVKFIEDRGKGWITRCKSNRKVRAKGDEKWRSLAEFVAEIPRDHEHFRPVIIKDRGREQTYWCYRQTVQLHGLGRVGLLVAFDEKELKGDPVLLATNQKHWGEAKILKAYSLRWAIETFYRDGKQHLGLEACELRNLQGARRHWHLVFLAYTLLQLGALRDGLARWMQSNGVTIGSRCRLAAAETARTFVLWALKARQAEQDLEALLDRVFAGTVLRVAMA